MNTTQGNSELEELKRLRKKTIKVYGPPGTGKTYTLIERILKKHLRFLNIHTNYLLTNLI